MPKPSASKDQYPPLPTPHERILEVDPPLLLPWLTTEQKNSEVVLLDLEVDVIADKLLQFDLNIVFNPLPIRRGILTKEDFYVGSSGAQVLVQAHKGHVKDYTPAVELAVNYTNSTTRRRNATLCIKPSAKLRGKNITVDVTPPSITLQADSERTFSASFQGAERTLAPVYLSNAVRWDIALPRGSKVVRDFLIGNLYLFARLEWESTPASGFIQLRPSDVRFFDSKREPLPKRNSVRMAFELWKAGVRLDYKNGFEIVFSERGS